MSPLDEPPSGSTKMNLDAGHSRAKATDVYTGVEAGAVVNGEWSTGLVPSMDSCFEVFGSYM